MSSEEKGFDVWQVRKQFPMLEKTMHGKPLIYLDSAATALKPQCVIDTISEFYSQNYGTVHRAVYELSGKATTRYNEVREKLRQFLGAAFTEEIVFTKGTTEGINMIASLFGKTWLKEGDEVIISQLEHHSNIVPWQFLRDEKGIVLKVIPSDDKGDLILEEYAKLLTEKTKLVSIAHVVNSIGTINPVKEIIALAHQHGAKVLLDGAQAAPHMPVDVQELDVDFYVFSAHKAFGPTGLGVLYGKKKLLESLPPYHGGGDMIKKVTFEETLYQETPLKFEAGTPPIAQVLGLGAALDFIQSIGLKEIAGWEHNLTEYATEQLQQINGLTIIGNPQEKAAIISFVVEGMHSYDLGTLLDLKGVAVRTGQHCAQPAMECFGQSATVRASFAPYTTFHEVDALLKALKESLLLLSPTISY
jgi:cysteine desulfurase/selenocysteine lyase